MKKWMLIVIAAVLVAGALGAVFGLGLFSANQAVPVPLLYMDGEDVYLAVGEKTLLLTDAAVEESGGVGTLRGEFSQDDRYLYYLANVSDGGTGGTLMAVDTGAMTQTHIANDVYLAKAGGSRVLYFTNAQGGMVGTLYSAEPGKQPEKIADSVVQSFYGFSKNYKSIYYTTQSALSSSGAAGSDGYHYQLFIKVGAGQAVKRYEADAGGSGILSTLFSQIVLGDKGELLFSRLGGADEDKAGQYVLTLNAGGSANNIADNATIAATFETPEDFLYSTGTELYYKAPSQAKIRLSQNYYAILFAPYYGADAAHVSEKHFLLAERKTGEDGAAQDKVTLYEQEIGKDKVKIIAADPGSAVVNAQLNAVCFTDEGRLFLMVKKGGEWDERISLCDSALGFIFDRSGNYIYYIEKSSADATDGDLMCRHLSDGKTNVLQYDVTAIVQTGVGLFARTADGEVYWLNGRGQEQQLPENTLTVKETVGGYYAIIKSDAYDIVYFSKGAKEGKTLCYNASVLVTTGGFALTINIDDPNEIEVPGTDPEGSGATPKTMFASIGLNEDQSAAMVMVLADLLYYSDAYNKTDYSTATVPPLGYEDGSLLLSTLLNEDLSKEAEALAIEANTCYWSISQYEADKTEIALEILKSTLSGTLDLFQDAMGTTLEKS